LNWPPAADAAYALIMVDPPFLNTKVIITVSIPTSLKCQIEKFTRQRKKYRSTLVVFFYFFAAVFTGKIAARPAVGPKAHSF
jgi:hypothetical protein